MIPPIDPTSLPGPAQRIVSDQAPQKLRLMAAKGIVPGLRPDAILSVIVLLSLTHDADVAREARGTLMALPDQLLRGALDADLPEAVLMALAENYTDHMDVLEKLIQMPRLPLEAVEYLAQHGDEATTELVATNEERVLAHPRIVELIYMNSRCRMSTANRLIELAVRNDIELTGIPAWKEVVQAIKGELVPEKSSAPLPEDELFWEQHQLAAELADPDYEDAYYEDEEGQEQLEDKFKPLYQRLAEMTTSEKIRRAMLGSREERMMLIREQNKMVSSAAARSPMLQEADVALITKSRGVTDDVLRIIATNPEWLRSYQIKRNLVENAKTPIAVATRLITQLRENDLRKLAKNKNVSGAVQQHARRHLERRNQ